MQQQTFGTSFFDSVRRSGIYRADSRWFGGVASGYAARMNISPLIIRTAFIVLALLGGLGAVIYGVSWALLPEQSDGRIHLQEAFAGRFDGALALAGAITLTGLISSGASLSVFGSAFAAAFWGLFVFGIIALVLGAIALLIVAVRPKRPRPPAPASAPLPPTEFSPTTPAPGYEQASPMAGSVITPLATPLTARAADEISAPITESADAGAFTAGAPAAGPSVAEPPAARAAAGPPAASAEPVLPAEEEPRTPPAAPPLPVYQKAPARRRAPGPGRRIYALAFAFPLLIAAGILAAWHWGTFSITYPLVAIFGAAAVLLGLVIIGLGVAGRRAGAINFLASLMLVGGLITGGISFDSIGSQALAWDETRTDLRYFNIEVTSVEQLQRIDWDAVANAQWATLNLRIDPDGIAPNTVVDIPLQFAADLMLETRASLPIDLRISGLDAYVYGSFYDGDITTTRATGSRDAGYSIAQDGHVRYQNFPADNALTVNVTAPSGSIQFNSWND